MRGKREYLFIRKFQSPKTGLCFSHKEVRVLLPSWEIKFQSLKRVYAFLTHEKSLLLGIVVIMFQSPKTGLCYSHIWKL